jgi:hypothetical protein
VLAKADAAANPKRHVAAVTLRTRDNRDSVRDITYYAALSQRLRCNRRLKGY